MKTATYTILRWAGTIGLTAYILSVSDLSAIGALLVGTKVLWLLAAFGVYMVDRTLAAWKWTRLFNSHGHHLRLTAAISIYLRSSFLGAALPATLGSDAIRARIAGRFGGNYTFALGTILVERGVGIGTLVAAAFVGVVAFGSVSLQRSMVPTLLLAVIVLLATAVVAYRVHRNHDPHANRRGTLARVQRFVGETARWTVYLAQNRFNIMLVALTAMTQHYLVIVITWMLATALGLGIPFFSLLWIWPIIMLSMRLPISVQGFGVRELLLWGFLRGEGFGTEAAISLGVFSGGLDLLFVGIGGLFVLAAGTQDVAGAPVTATEGASTPQSESG